MFPKSLTFFFLPKRQFSNEKVWCLETKLWSKVILFQRVYGYAETSAWFAHVTDCYYFGQRNSNKFFLTTKFIFAQSHPYWWGNFEQLWCSLFDRNTCAMNWLFLHLEKRSYSDFSTIKKFVILEPYDHGNQIYLEKTLKAVQCNPTWP